jgi:hypothetical protein
MDLPQHLTEAVRDLVSDAEANEVRAYRRTRYWLTGLAICARVTKLREYVGKINKADVEFLRTDRNIGEAIGNLHTLAAELTALAVALEPQRENVTLFRSHGERQA